MYYIQSYISRLIKKNSLSSPSFVLLGDVLSASDELSQVFEKYTCVIVLGQSATESSKTNTFNNGPSLLDLSSPTENVACESTLSTPSATSTDHRSNMDVLGDIFSVLEKPVKSDTNLLMPNIMQPISVSPVNKKSEHTS